LNNDYLTVKEVADRFSISKSSVYRNIKTGYFPSIKTGKRLYIPGKALSEKLTKNYEEERKKAFKKYKTLVALGEKLERSGKI